MNNSLINLYITLIIVTSCSGFIPETRIDLDYIPEVASNSYENLKKQGMALYDYIPDGFDRISNSMFSSATDESDYAPIGSTIDMFQKGTWSSLKNPDDIWQNAYRGIRLSNIFLKNSRDYKSIILRDTTTSSGLENYKQQCADLEYLRAEAKVIQAYIYFELLKRYSNIPIIDDVYDPESFATVRQREYDDVVEKITQLLDDAEPDLQMDWKNYDTKSFGRINKGTALALKSRVLLYWASPQNNTARDRSRWEMAADAAFEVIKMNKYKLDDNYRNLFLGARAHQSEETIFSRMKGKTNSPEMNNYPISFNKGKTGTCPSGNLVDAYENIDGSEFRWSDIDASENPYENRDPRLRQTILVNGDVWNGRKMECYEGGRDGIDKKFATSTGYYLKKFINEDVDLEKGQTVIHSWILFRYAEILLNFAEAMNEAYGPDITPYEEEFTARWAVNEVRKRAGMPPVVASNDIQMRERIHHERRIELAFEEHRFWDVRRWGIECAKDVLNQTIKGVKIVDDNGHFVYNEFNVEPRKFEDKMIVYPIPEGEIRRANGNIVQNMGW